MDTIINGVYLTRVIPGYRSIAQSRNRTQILDRLSIDSWGRKTDNPPLKFSNLRYCGGGFPRGGAAQISKSCISDR